jgi:hypothetical protein
MMKMDVKRSSETPVHIRTTSRYISEDGTIYNYRFENLSNSNITSGHELIAPDQNKLGYFLQFFFNSTDVRCFATDRG